VAFSVRQVRRALGRKLAFEEDTGRRHPTFYLKHDGKVVAVTHISHSSSGDEMSEGVLSAMARQVGVTGPIFRRAIDCTLSRDDFVRQVLDSA
jgi:hypothetical protein